MQQPFTKLNLTNFSLFYCNNVKCLVILHYINEQLTFKCHIEYIEQKKYPAQSAFLLN